MYSDVLQRGSSWIVKDTPISQEISKILGDLPETGDKDQIYLLLHQSLNSALLAVHTEETHVRVGDHSLLCSWPCVSRARASSYRTFARTRKANWKKLLLALAPVPGPQPGKLSSCTSPPAPMSGPSIHPARPVDPTATRPDHTGRVGLRQWFSVQLTVSLKWSQHKEHHVCSGMQIIPTECR